LITHQLARSLPFMDPTIALHKPIDPCEHSPLIRGLVLSLNYAVEHGGIGLTQTGAMNRKFVTFAANAFNWPGYTAKELLLVNKVLDEHKMPPLEPIHASLRHFKLVRRYKDKLRITKLGKNMLKDPQDLFDLAAPVYLYRFQHAPPARQQDYLAQFWHVFLNVLNLEAEAGCTVRDLMRILYGFEDTDNRALTYCESRLELKYDILKPLCWLGILREDREGRDLLEDGIYYKTPLWYAALHLESDPEVGLRRLS
jgi:hypothetical protein